MSVLDKAIDKLAQLEALYKHAAYECSADGDSAQAEKRTAQAAAIAFAILTIKNLENRQS